MSTLTATPTAPAAAIVASTGPVPMRSQSVHLTRRGRLLITSLVLLVLAGLFLVSAGRSDAGDPGAVTTTRVVVQPGQTLWQVAADAMPGTDTREAITHIRELNALTSSVVRPGQSLLVPASA